jgi:hypothetical protein
MAGHARSEDFLAPAPKDKVTGENSFARLSYARSLYEARAQKNSTTKKYGCTLIFEKKDVKTRTLLEGQVLGVCKAEWGDKALDMIKNGLIKSPFLDGAGKEARNKQTGELHPGMGSDVYFIRTQANEKFPPAVRWTNPNVQETETTVYSGCYGKALVNIFAWKNDEGGLGVSFGISMFQKHRDGDRLGGGGGPDIDSHYETIADEGDAPDATKNGAGASGLFG